MSVEAEYPDPHDTGNVRNLPILREHAELPERPLISYDNINHLVTREPTAAELDRRSQLYLKKDKEAAHGRVYPTYAATPNGLYATTITPHYANSHPYFSDPQQSHQLCVGTTNTNFPSKLFSQ